jgi:hypothetical protein
MKLRPLLPLLAAAIILSGCSGMESAKGWNNRYGPETSISPDAVTNSVDAQLMFMAQFERAAGLQPTPYQVTLAGFNYVDEQCDAYLHELFALEVDLDRARKSVDGLGLLTNAVLGAVPASKASMAVVTQAFGLSSQYVDTLSKGYLLGARASTVLSTVEKMKAIYRDQASATQKQINSRPEVYSRIRGYLQLCMPQTIEAKMSETLASTTAVAGKEATGSSGPGSSQTIKLVSP